MKTKRITALITCFICAFVWISAIAPADVKAAPQGEYTALKAKQIAHTRPERIFSVAGSNKKFILLDDTEDGYFILTYDMYGARVFDPDDTEKFDIDDTNNIAYWLNNDFLEKGNYYSRRTYKLPDAIIRNLVEHDWLTEAGGPHTDFQQDYITRCKVALLSKTEAVKYYDRYGYADDQSIASVLLRTAYGTGAQTVGTILTIIVKHVAKEAMIRAGKSVKNTGLRPVFYLDKDFFAKEKINITTAGDDIRKIIKTKHTAKELSAIYSKSEVAKLTQELPPQALNVHVVGNPIVGETLRCTYDYYAPAGQPEEGTKISWIRYEPGSSVGHTIVGANGMEYVPTAKDVGKGISVRVMPACASKTGRVTEAYFYRNDILEIMDVSNVYIEELKIIGNNTCGGTVFADYKYFHPAYLIEKGTVYEWQAANDDGVFTSVPILGSLRQADIPKDFGYKYIRCKVTLANGIDYVSEPLEVAKEKLDSNLTFKAHSLPDSKQVECKAGQTFDFERLIFNHVSSVTFTTDANTEVTADGCKVYSVNCGDRIYHAVTKDTCENIDIKIKTNYDGTLTIRNISVAVKE